MDSPTPNGRGRSESNEQGKAAFQMKEYQSAADYFQRAADSAVLASDKVFQSQCLNNRARALLALQRWTQAQLAAQQAKLANPAFLKAPYTLAEIFAAQGKFAEAIAECDLTLKLAIENGASAENINDISNKRKLWSELHENSGTSGSSSSSSSTISASAAAPAIGPTALGALNHSDEKYTADPLWQAYDVARILAASTANGLTEGETFCLVPDIWWRSWMDYTGYDQQMVTCLGRILRATKSKALPGPTDPRVIETFKAEALPLPEIVRSASSTSSGTKAPPSAIPTRDMIIRKGSTTTSTTSTTSSSAYDEESVMVVEMDGNGGGGAGSSAPSSGASSSSLSPDAFVVRDGLAPEVDYQFIPFEAAVALEQWYGIEGPRLTRYVVKDGKGGLTIDVYPEKNRFSSRRAQNGKENDIDDDEDEETGGVSKKMEKLSISSSIIAAGAAAGAGAGGNASPAPPMLNKRCAKCDLPAKHRCSLCQSVYYCSPECQRIDFNTGHKSVCRAVDAAKLNGKVGLVNIGNTCFMNSSIQALSAVWPITQYFLSERWKSEINLTNPLGTKGKLVTAYAELLDDLWRSRDGGAIAPSAFKRAVSGFQERFSGWQQHDAHELLGYVLDGLHEDLNRVLKKQNTEDEESNNRPDDVVAKIALAKTKLRNDSVINDAFSGQLKSRLECPSCKRISVKFDAYNMLQVPIAPMPSSKRYLSLLVHRLFYDPENPSTWKIPVKGGETGNGDASTLAIWNTPRSPETNYSKPVRLERYILQVENQFTVSSIRGAVSQLTGIPPRNMEFEKLNRHNREMADIFVDPNEIASEFPNAEYATRGNVFELLAFETASPNWTQPKAAEGKGEGSSSSSTTTTSSTTPSPPLPPQIHVTPEDTEVYNAWLQNLPEEKRMLMLVDVRGFDSAAYANYGKIDTAGIQHPYAAVNEGTKSLGPLIVSVSRNTTIASLRMILARQLYPLLGTNVKKEMIKAKAVAEKVSEAEIINANAVTDADVHLYIAANMLLSSSPVLMKKKTAWMAPMKEDGTDADPENSANTLTVGSCGAFPHVDLIEHHRHHYDFVWSKAVVFLRGTKLDPFINQKAVVEVIDTESSIREMEGFRRRSAVDLEGCVEKFRVPEVLDEQNKWYCSVCKDHVRARKTLEVWSLPDNLIIHLKRFAQSGNSMRFSSYEKDGTLVRFPLQGLDMTPYALSEQQGVAQGIPPSPHIYDCVAVINHSGSTYGGHYYSYCNHDVATKGAAGLPGKWYTFDDSRVSPMDAESVVSSTAYLMVYKKRPVERN